MMTFSAVLLYRWSNAIIFSARRVDDYSISHANVPS